MKTALPDNNSILLQSSSHFTVHHLRLEKWNLLKTTTAKLRRDAKNELLDLSDVYDEIEETFKELTVIEQYFVYPGIKNLKYLRTLYRKKEFTSLNNIVSALLKTLISETYRYKPSSLNLQADEKPEINVLEEDESEGISKHYFEVLFVDSFSEPEEEELKIKLESLRHDTDDFGYELMVQQSFQDTLISILFNYNIQVVVLRYDIEFKSKNTLKILRPFIASATRYKQDEMHEDKIHTLLAEAIKKFRPEVDVYLVTNNSLGELEDDTLSVFRRIFYRKEDLQELHLSILSGIKKRFEAPFFNALKEYSQKPTSVFHAMPISRGNSVFKSFWIKDFSDFYGRNLFLAETSATTGGLDSLLQPTGPLKGAQELAATAFGSNYTFFATNGTSTANKIVQQAIVEPGDVVLVDRDCHKSHHYGLVLAGAYPVYLDSYPISEYSMYGAVPLNEIKERLYELKDAGRLDKVKMLVLTNCTFDGLVYHVEKIMEEILAIKPDIIFLWDEAWFGFAAFTYVYRQRTAMYVAKKLKKKYRTAAYKLEYKQHLNGLGKNELPRLPDPKKVKIRVYSTQSTHKTLSSFRQGSMIHIHDEEFKRLTEEPFLEAYMTHTSTSANYQILASLDVGRRQTQFEGFEMVEKSIEKAMVLRAKVNDHPQLSKYFAVLTVEDFIPKQHRKSGLKEYYDPKKGWYRFEQAWETDEFVLDPTKINLHIGRTGVDGDTFKNKYLMDQFNIQINKTSRNTVLFMTNIGTTRGSVAYLISVLLKISRQLDEEIKAMNAQELKIHHKTVKSLTEDNPSLPDFSRFHDFFRVGPDIPGGDIRKAYFMSYKEENCEYISPEDCLKKIKKGAIFTSASFVIPYPPGFPILVPGQVISKEIVEFMIALDVSEIHGYRSKMGLHIFKDSVLS